MSFTAAARQVRDPSTPPWLRLSSIRACVRSYCYLTQTPYAATLQHFGLAQTLHDRLPPPTEEVCRQALNVLERARNIYLDRLRSVERSRIRAKMRGNRQLSNAERELLRALREAARIGPVAEGDRSAARGNPGP